METRRSRAQRVENTIQQEVNPYAPMPGDEIPRRRRSQAANLTQGTSDVPEKSLTTAPVYAAPPRQAVRAAGRRSAPEGTPSAAVREAQEYYDFDDVPQQVYVQLSPSDAPEAAPEPPRKRRGWVWVVLLLLLAGLLAGATYVGIQRPELVEPVVVQVRDWINGISPTATPAPTPEPTEEPTPAPTAVVLVEDAVVLSFQANASYYPTLAEPIQLTILTSLDTYQLTIVDGNGVARVNAQVGDSFETVEGRQWRLELYFDAPYEGVLEALPGNEAGWNDQGGARLNLVVRDTQAQPTAIPIAPVQTTTQGTAPADEVVGILPVAVNATAYENNVALSAFDREVPITFGLAAEYAKIKGVTTFRATNLRQNAAYGNVIATENALDLTWTQEVGQPADSPDALAQALIVQWPIDIRNIMPLNADKLAKSTLKEVIYASPDGNIYFLDLEDGSQTRAPMYLGQPMTGAASVFPNGIPMLFVGAGQQGKTDGEPGIYAVGLLKMDRRGWISGNDAAAPSLERYANASALVSPSADVMLSVGGNGLLYSLKLDLKFDLATADMRLTKPSLQLVSTTVDGQTAAQSAVDGGLSAMGEIAYYGTRDGILLAANVNTMDNVWAVDLGAPIANTTALNAEGTQLYVLTLAGENIPARIACLDAATGETLWTKPYSGVFAGAPLVGEGILEGRIYATMQDASYTSANLICLDAATGEEIWTTTLGATSSSPIALYDTEKAFILQGDNQGILHLVDAQTGEGVTELALSGAVVGSPSAFNDQIVVITADGRLNGIRLR